MALEGSVEDVIGRWEADVSVLAFWKERDGKLKVAIKEHLMKELFPLGGGLWEPARGVRPSKQLPPPDLRGQGNEWHGMSPVWLREGRFPPAAMAKVRGCPAKLHPGSGGIEYR